MAERLHILFIWATDLAKMKVRKKKPVRSRLPAGSALILAVVLTSLLAIVGVLFVMVSRVDRISTSAISENRELNLAVDTVVARIARELTWDVPGVNTLEYYDYPDLNNNWLASLEPNELRIWPQVSNLASGGVPLRNLVADYVPEYQPGVRVGWPADADGDCVADSIWIELSDMTSSKGRPIFAAIRVVDNGGMLNANTGHMFDPTGIRERIDGSSQMQINLVGLSWRPGVRPYDPCDDPDLRLARCGNDGALALDLDSYERFVVWGPGVPALGYTPFDISDELEIRNRLLLNHEGIDTRLEAWGGEFRAATELSTPIDSGTAAELNKWFYRAQHMVLGPNDVYSYRHLATTYNMDRIIRPRGVGDANVAMANINFADANSLYRLYDAIRRGLVDGGVAPVQSVPLAAQMAVNIWDYRDENDNNNVRTFSPPGDLNVYYGFERPCIYISELARKYYTDPANPNRLEHMSYAIELYNDYSEENDPCDISDPLEWRVVIDDPCRTVPVNWSGNRRFHAIVFENPSASLVGEVDYWKSVDGPSPPDGETRVSPDIELGWPAVAGANSYDVYFGTDSNSVESATTTSAEYMGRQDPCEYDPVGSLTRDTTYYWRIDALDAGGAVIGDPGDVWKFTVAASAGEEARPDIFAIGAGDIIFRGRGRPSTIELQRYVAETDKYVTVDSVRVRPWLDTDTEPARSFQRDVTVHKCIRRLWDMPGNEMYSLTLGHSNSYVDADANMIQAHPANRAFTNVGEIGMVFAKPAYYRQGVDPVLAEVIGYRRPPETEDEVRINLADPVFQQIFNYVTVFDPVNDFIDNDGDGLGVDGDGNGVLDPYEEDPDELKVAGRININTAPWFVIAQLPWMTPGIAQAIVARRDTMGGFRSIGELMQVLEMHLYANDSIDLAGFPDLTPSDGDGAQGNLEERDVIFARISNLVTVRSDVFTAYILVRIGTDGPQRRVVAILDRSNVYGAGNVVGKVAVRALHPVPDPR